MVTIFVPMEPWDEERLSIWLMWAMFLKPSDTSRHFLDTSDQTFFTLECIAGKYRPWSRSGSGIMVYTGSKRDIILSKVYKVENNSLDIIEVPRYREIIDELEKDIELVKEDPKQHYMLREKLHYVKATKIRSWIISLDLPDDAFRLVFPWND